MHMGLHRKSHVKASNDAPVDGGGYTDPVEQVRTRLDRSVDIGSPLLYPF
jgi:hypothetical protein